jgi:hypothetical protein
LRRLYHGAYRRSLEARRLARGDAEALGVAVELDAGAALVYSVRVMDAVSEHSAG